MSCRAAETSVRKKKATRVPSICRLVTGLSKKLKNLGLTESEPMCFLLTIGNYTLSPSLNNLIFNVDVARI